MKRFEVMLLCAAAAISGCRRAPAAPAPQKPAARLTIVTDRPTLDDLALVPPDSARRLRPDVFRLRPDRRFLIALGELDRLVGGEPAVRFRLSWSGGAWRIESRGGMIATAPEISHYGDLRRILTERARRLLAERRPSAPGAARSVSPAALQKACDGFESGPIIAALRTIGNGWTLGSVPDAEAAAAGARAFTLLSLQSLDLLEMGDLLRAKALALSALAEAAGRPPDKGNEALLADLLGYSSDAARAAADLPADDARRLSVTRQTAALVAAAGRPEAAPLTRYLALLSLSAGGDPRAWSAFEAEHFGADGFSLPVLRAASALHSFEMNGSLGEATIFATLEALPGARPPARPTPVPEDGEPTGPREWSDALIQNFVASVRAKQKADQAPVVRGFESALGAECGNQAGALWDPDACRAWYRGYFYSGLYTLGRRYLDELADAGAARRLAEYLQGSPAGPGAQFARWYAGVSSILSGKPPSDAQFQDLAELTWFGLPVVERTATALNGRYYPQYDVGPEIGARVAQRLDGRPPHLDFMTEVAGNPLLDLAMVEQLCRSWIDLGAKAELGRAARCFGFLASTREFQTLIDRRDLSLEARSGALGVYCDLPSSSASFCRAAFRALASESGYDRIVTFPWMGYLDKRKDYPESQRAAEGWLAHHDPSVGLMWSIYRGRLAHALSMQGRHREAWKIIEPELPTYQGFVMLWGSEILERLGRHEDAMTLAQHALDRYPDGGEQRAVLAELLWRARRDDEAALVLEPVEPAYRVDERLWSQDVSLRFTDVFRAQPNERVESAVAALKGRGIHERKLSSLVAPMAAAGRDDLAFQLATTAAPKLRHAWDEAGAKADAFGYLVKARGRSEAAAWIQTATPTNKRESTLEAFFDKKAFSLLWDAVSPADEPRQTEWVWLLRAAASVADPAIGAAHRPELLEHFREPSPRNPNRLLGRYLLRLEDRDAVLREVVLPDDRCKAVYFFGLEQDTGRHLSEASDWYQVAYDGCRKTWAWRLAWYARTTLASWYGSGQNLQAIEARTAR